MYKIVGADQKEYGPVTEDQLRQWIAEGRANGQTLVKLNDGPWKPLSTYPEFSGALGSSAIPPLSTPSGNVPPTAGGSISMSSRPASVNGMAITGLICSVLGLFCCGPILSTLGLIFSAIGLSQINQDPIKYTGKGVAVAGIIVALAGYALFAVLLATGVLRRAFRGVHF